MGQGQEQRQQTPAASAPAQAATPTREGDAQDTLGNAALVQRMGAGDEANAGAEEDAGPAASGDDRVTLNVSVTDTTWTTSGSLADIADEVEEREAGAHVSWRPTYSVSTEQDQGTSYVTAVTIDIPITKEMPVWTDKGEAPPEDQREWERFLRCLEEHEQGHITRARAGFVRLGRMMIDMPEDTAVQTFQRGVTEVQAASNAYDASTGHGQTQGAVLWPDE